MIKPEEIPQYTGDLELLEKACSGLKKDAGHIRSVGADVHTHFQGLSAYYKAPEAEQLFATTKPVKERAHDFAEDLGKVSTALSEYATEIRPLVKKLDDLKATATTFVADHKDDDDWQYDEDKVDEHNELRDEITRTVAAFWAAERTCHNKITALFNGDQMVAGDGSDRKNQYGFNADDMEKAKLPWGDPVEEKHHAWEIGHWVKSFVWDGLIVDGVWGTLKGLGTLVGFGGWDAMGQAWKGLAQLATGLAITSIPGAGTLFWALPDDKLPSWLRDSRTAMKETGKALVAWDEWGKNPGRAAGAVTFNVVTTVFTGGAGGAASGAGKAGAVAKTLAAAGKAGRVIDPMTYITKGAGAGLSKIGDIAKGLKGIESIDIPKLPDGTVHIPEGSYLTPDGKVHLPDGSGTPIPDDAVKIPKDSVALPDGGLLPPGSVKLPGEGAPRFMDTDGNIYKSDGSLAHDAAHAPTDIVDRPAAGSDVPRVDSPTRQPDLVAAGARPLDNATHVNLGSGLDDLGRTGDNLPGGRVGDDVPGGHAGDNLPGGRAGDNLPGGHVGDNLPGGHAHDHGPGPSASHEPPSGGHSDGPNNGGHHDAAAAGGDAHGVGDATPPLGRELDSAADRLDATGDGVGDLGHDVGDVAHDAGHAAHDAGHAADDAGDLGDNLVDDAGEGDVPYIHDSNGSWSGAGWVEQPSEYAGRVYESLRATPNHVDVPQMAKHTGIDESVIREVKTHMIRTQHDVAVRPGVWKRGLFTPRDDIAALWDGARKGTLDADQVMEFKHLMTHEYVESHLMKRGLPYVHDQTGLWRVASDGTFEGRRSPKSLSAAGAHDLAPNPARGGFGMGWQKLGLKHPSTVLADDLSNIDGFVNDIVKELKAKGLDLK
ncbi:hypothetical protein [Streptomyces cucumeris]|uniref:hypothetical protein n=1 Tax=Streptomyces cucumeris TaxID=2962890 RepID=UPI0020C8DF60|nr:hypothetical protein [Streptomyces sp. NEAU-Y11]MCP9207052.1 hypothetical protein [Streptomyces sp. NEAU-Y11]